MATKHAQGWRSERIVGSILPMKKRVLIISTSAGTGHVRAAQALEKEFKNDPQVGEVIHEDGAFRAEIRGPAAALDEQRGRIFAHGCDADLGDGRCTIDLTGAAYRGTGTVVGPLDRRRFTVSGIEAFADRWFERWNSGDDVTR